jgi:flavin-binding protein dodecin
MTIGGRMSVARVSEITARGSSYDEAIRTGIERATQTLRGVEHVWVKDHEIYLDDGTVREHQVALKVTFLLDD